MVTFLFWNINRHPIKELIAQLVHTQGVDVLMLAESEIHDEPLLAALNKGQSALYYADIDVPRRVHVYFRYSPKFVRPIYDGEGISIRHIQLPLLKGMLLVTVHLPSKLYETADDQIFTSIRTMRLIESAEDGVGHCRTAIVGDFNMNPFDSGMLAADGFHAVMDRRTADRGFRCVRGENRRFLYNPMWSFFGDDSRGPPGTYYYDSGRHVNLYWHMLDQVLLRPDLLRTFDSHDLEIVTKVGITALLTDIGRPNATLGSDHLPVIFKLNLKGGDNE